jgi:hypothetical protein
MRAFNRKRTSMPPELSNEAWAQVRRDYEQSERPVEDICAEHGISAGTLRHRMRRWGWTRRRAPIPSEGPPPAPMPAETEGPPVAPAFDAAMSPIPAGPLIETVCVPIAPQAEAAGAAEAPEAIVPRLQSAIGRVLPTIESVLARLAAAPAHPREIERAARALAALTRTLRELNELLSAHRAAAGRPAADDDDMPEDIDAFRNELARRIDAFVASRTGDAVDGTEPQEG